MAHTLEKEGEQKGEEEGLQESRLREKILELVEDALKFIKESITSSGEDYNIFQG